MAILPTPVPVNIPILREKTQQVTVRVNGEDFGTWDTKDGGEVASDAGDTFEPGGMSPPIALGGSAKTGNVTLRRHVGHDLWRRMGALMDAAKKAHKVTIHQQPLDPDKNPDPYGSALVYTGKMLRCTPPGHDSTSNTVAMVEIEVVIDGYPVFG